MSGSEGPGVCGGLSPGGVTPSWVWLVRERQGALEVRCLAENGAARAQAEIQSQYEQ